MAITCARRPTRWNGRRPRPSASCAPTRSVPPSARSPTPEAARSPIGWRNSRSPPARPSPPASRSRVRPPSPRADEPVPETADLVGSWTVYQRLSGGGIGAASLDELLAGPGTTVPPVSPSPGPEPSVVDVRSLLYRGDRALARAQELRAAARQATGDSLRALVDEVCDLVALALEPNPDRAARS